jgi:hypothetical protein
MRLAFLPLCTALFALASSAGCSSESCTENCDGAGAGTGGSSGGSAGAAAGAGGSAAGAGGSSAGAATDSPSDTTQAGIEAFLAAGSYKTSDWAAETAEPRASTDAAHARVRVWFNKTLRQSQADGDPVTMRDSGSMVVKDLYDTGTNVIGQGVLLRSGTSWIYYCTASEAGRCYGGQAAGQKIYTMSATTGGCSCHGAGSIITPIPPP